MGSSPRRAQNRNLRTHRIRPEPPQSTRNSCKDAHFPRQNLRQNTRNDHKPTTERDSIDFAPEIDSFPPLANTEEERTRPSRGRGRGGGGGARTVHVSNHVSANRSTYASTWGSTDGGDCSGPEGGILVRRFSDAY